jgi:hypothetical protein
VAFRQQSVTRARGRRIVARRYDSGEAPVCFFRPGTFQVAGAQTGLDVADGDAGVKSGKRGSRARCGVALHQNVVGLKLREDRSEPAQHACKDIAQRLPRLHDIEIVVGLQRKRGHHLIQHLAVLTGDADARQDSFLLGECADDRCHFDGFRTGTEY